MLQSTRTGPQVFVWNSLLELSSSHVTLLHSMQHFPCKLVYGNSNNPLGFKCLTLLTSSSHLINNGSFFHSSSCNRPQSIVFYKAVIKQIRIHLNMSHMLPVQIFPQAFPPTSPSFYTSEILPTHPWRLITDTINSKK